MSRLNNVLRKVKNKIDQSRLKNTDFSLVASNCNGAFILHDLNLKFRSPFVNLWIRPKEYIKYLENMEHYEKCEMEFVSEEGIEYPIGKLDDVRIYFQHYKSEQEAEQIWEKRQARLNKNNLFILFTDRDGCTYEDLKRFDALPYENKKVLCCKEYPELKSAVYVKEFAGEKQVGDCFEFCNKISPRKYYDVLKYVDWFNFEKKDSGR